MLSIGRDEYEYAGRASEESPFTAIIDRYYSKDITPDVLDVIQLELEELKGLKDLKRALDEEVPRFTTLFRYDPSSLDTKPDTGGCFGYASSMGARVGFARLFQDLTSDVIKVVRTADEVAIVIDHPSALVETRKRGVTRTDEPTVLFTTRQLGQVSLEDKTEELQFGTAIAHGRSPISSLPNDWIVGPYIFMAGYSDLSRESHEPEPSI